MAKLYAGLDVSDEQTSICVVDEKAQPVFQQAVPTTPTSIADALRPYRRSLRVVAQEAGTLAPWLHGELIKKRFPCVCWDARRTRAAMSGQRNKTDRNDARDIAVLAQIGFHATAHVKSGEAQRLMLLLRCRRTLKRKATDIEIALRMIVKSFGARISVSRKTFVLQQGKNRDPVLVDVAAAMMRAHKAIKIETDAMDKTIGRLTKADKVCRRLMTMPGVGPITALTYKAGVDNPDRFKTSRTVGAYFGLTPRRVQSGKSDYGGRLSRYGNKEVRSMLYEAASTLLTTVKKESRLRTWGRKLAKIHGHKFAASACARKMAVTLHRMWVSERDFQAFP